MNAKMDANFFDTIIIGGGPAGLTAALYMARARYRVLVIEKEKFGGQITITSEVVNYPGIEFGSGDSITAVMRKQAENFGAEFLLAEVEHVDFSGEEKIIRTSRGEFRAFGAILATGANPRSIGFDGEEDFKGRGVAYCATCDGEFFTNLDVFVVGGGFAAAEEAIFLTKYARHVTMLVRRGQLSCPASIAEAVENHEKITIRYNTEVDSVVGDGKLERLCCRDCSSDESWIYTPPEGESFGVFVFAGYVPATHLFQGHVVLDEQGYVVTDENGLTNVPGVYAAGDLRKKVLRQVVTATADGAIAATELERYVAQMQEKTGKIPVKPTPRKVQPTHAASPAATDTSTAQDGFFTADIKAQLVGVFGKMAEPLTLRTLLDSRPVSRELEAFMKELGAITDKLTIEYEHTDNSQEAPSVHIIRQDGTASGVAFYGVPGGHEFNSFVLGLYNVAGPGQALDQQTLARIEAIDKPLDLKILISLSCTMCPELVMAAQMLAAKNPHIKAAAYDINHFPQLKDEFKVMSVPCLIVNDSIVSFGKKNVSQVLDFITEQKL